MSKSKEVKKSVPVKSYTLSENGIGFDLKEITTQDGKVISESKVEETDVLVIKLRQLEKELKKYLGL